MCRVRACVHACVCDVVCVCVSVFMYVSVCRGVCMCTYDNVSTSMDQHISATRVCYKVNLPK